MSHLRRISASASAAPAERPSTLAFEPLGLDEAFRRFGPVLARRAVRLLGRRDEADDLVQDVFLAAHRYFARIRDPQALFAWLSVSLVRLARRRLRLRRLKSFLFLEDAPHDGAVVDHAADPALRLLATRIYASLDALPTEARIAWTLYRVEGEPLETVALLCGCSLATVKRRIAAAQEALKSAIDP